MNQHDDTRPQRLAVWAELEALDDQMSPLLDLERNPLDGQEPTDELIEHLLPLVEPEAIGVETRAANRRRGSGRRRLRTWLGRADYWSPYIDLEMVTAARDFDPNAWDGATHDEREAVMALWLELIGPEETPAEYAERAASTAAAANWGLLGAATRKKVSDRIIRARSRKGK